MRPNNTYYLLDMLLLFGVILNSCKQHNADSEKKYRLRVVDAKGYLVSKDSIEPPKIIPRENPRMVPAIANKMFVAQANEHKIVRKGTVFYVVPQVFTPWWDSFLPLKKVAAINLPIKTGLPTVFAVKEVRFINPNQHKFMLFNCLQSYHGFVNKGNENLWLNTNAENKFKYIVKITSLPRSDRVNIKIGMEIKQRKSSTVSAQLPT